MGASCSSFAAEPPAGPFRGPAADSRLGELLLDVLPVAFAAGFALDLSQALALCGATWRPRASQSALRGALLRQAPWLAAARAARRDPATRTTQLMRAAADGHELRVRELVAAGAPLRAADAPAAYTALHWAAEQADARILASLLAGKFEGRGAPVDAADAGGRTALMRAARRGHEGVVRLLLARGARQELQDRDGNTALLDAAVTNHAGVVELLSAAPGAALAARSRNRAGRTALAAAERRGRGAVAALLRAHGAAA
jgi:hypothetical protein